MVSPTCAWPRRSLLQWTSTDYVRLFPAYSKQHCVPSGRQQLDFKAITLSGEGSSCWSESRLPAANSLSDEVAKRRSDLNKMRTRWER